MKYDPTIARIRKVPNEISAAAGHDPKRLVEYNIKLQERHKDRLVMRRPSAERAGDAGEATR